MLGPSRHALGPCAGTAAGAAEQPRGFAAQGGEAARRVGWQGEAFGALKSWCLPCFHHDFEVFRAIFSGLLAVSRRFAAFRQVKGLSDELQGQIRQAAGL